MTRSRLVLALAALRVASATAPAAADEALAVHQELLDTWHAYKRAVVAFDGEAAVALLSPASLREVDRLRRFALRGMPVKTRKLPVSRQYVALILRQQVPAGELRSLSPRDLARRAIDAGWLAYHVTANTEIGGSRVTGDTAQAAVVGRDGATPLVYRFVRTAEGWRIELTSVLDVMERAMAEMMFERDMEPEPFVFYAIENTTGERPDAEIWKPLERPGDRPPPVIDREADPASDR